jgi:hypothetical protein
VSEQEKWEEVSIGVKWITYKLRIVGGYLYMNASFSNTTHGQTSMVFVPEVHTPVGPG